jgi:hypothetical protein
MIYGKFEAILSLVPDAHISSNDDVITWISPETPSVTEAQIAAEIVRLQAEYNSKEYQRLRVKEYPSMQEQLDMQYWDSINGTTTWQDAINAIKVKYPKPEGV